MKKLKIPTKTIDSIEVKYYPTICFELNKQYLLFHTSRNIFDTINGTYKDIPKKIQDLCKKLKFRYELKNLKEELHELEMDLECSNPDEVICGENHHVGLKKAIKNIKKELKLNDYGNNRIN